MPSSIIWGSPSMITRSLKVPGSLSSALQQRYVGLSESFGTKPHLRPVGNPAPPRPLRLESLTNWIRPSGLDSRRTLASAWYPPAAS